MGIRINNVNPALDAARMRAGTERPVDAQPAPAAQAGGRSAQAVTSATDTARAQSRVVDAEAYRLQTGARMAGAAREAVGQQQAAVDRVRQLAGEASDGLMLNANRQALNREALQQVARVDEVAGTAEFAGVRLLDGSQPEVQLDASGDRLALPTTTADAIGLSEVDLSTPMSATRAVDVATRASERLASAASDLAGSASRLADAATSVRDAAATAGGAEPLRDAAPARSAVETATASLRNQPAQAAAAQSNVLPGMAAALLGA